MSAPTPHPTPRAAPRRVLEDATGRRLRRMRWLGRAVALLFLVWLVVVILGGVGVGPASHLPFGNVLRPTAGPPLIRHPLPVKPTAAADLVPALPAPAVAAGATPGRSATAPGQTKKTTTTIAPGHSGVAPGQTKKTATTATTTTHGKAATAPGHTTTTATQRGRSVGHTKTTHTKTTATTSTVTTTTTPAPGKSHLAGKKP